VAGIASFVLCIERNATQGQALLLCESIRRWGGRHRTAPIVAVSPRPGLGIDAEARRRLAAMDVEYIDEPLNHVCPDYGTANRVFAAAWAEARGRSEWIVVLDSDTVFFDELDFPADADAGVRPVDVKGSATAGPGDQFEDYWTKLAVLGGVSLDRLPFIQTSVCGTRIRTSYNGGLVVVRREAGILRAWADLFARSIHAGLKPWRGSGLNVHASTGLVGESASEYWGSNQAALALAMWTVTSRVHTYPASYNIPLHLLVDQPGVSTWPGGAPPVHVHYHWLFAGERWRASLTALRDLNLAEDRLDWLAGRLPLR
jgi:hypothetical protein